jgi:hypothetical protein
MKIIANESQIVPIDTMICVGIDMLFRLIHVDEDDKATDIEFVTDITRDDFKSALHSTSQPMIDFLAMHHLIIDCKMNTVQFDIASFHKIHRELRILTVEYDTNKCIFPDRPDSLSVKYECVHDDDLDFNVSLIELVLEILTDFYYHVFNVNKR